VPDIRDSVFDLALPSSFVDHFMYGGRHHRLETTRMPSIRVPVHAVTPHGKDRVIACSVSPWATSAATGELGTGGPPPGLDPPLRTPAARRRFRRNTLALHRQRFCEGGPLASPIIGSQSVALEAPWAMSVASAVGTLPRSCPLSGELTDSAASLAPSSTSPSRTTLATFAFPSGSSTSKPRLPPDTQPLYGGGPLEFAAGGKDWQQLYDACRLWCGPYWQKALSPPSRVRLRYDEYQEVAERLICIVVARSFRHSVGERKLLRAYQSLYSAQFARLGAHGVGAVLQRLGGPEKRLCASSWRGEQHYVARSAIGQPMMLEEPECRPSAEPSSSSSSSSSASS